MSRGLSAAAKAYRGPRQWLCSITLPKSGTVLYFADAAADLVANGQVHKPYLRVTEAVKRHRALKLDGGGIALSNVDRYVQGLLDAEPVWEGANIILAQFLVGLDLSFEELRGKLASQRSDRNEVTFAIRPEVEPQDISVPGHTYEPLCTFRFGKNACGYHEPTAITVTVNVAERTSTSVTTTSVTDTGLAETVNAHVDRFVVFTTGAKKGKARRIKSNTATAFTFYQPLAGTSAGDKFIVITAANGIPKPLFTATTTKHESAVATTFTARTIGDSGLAMTVDEHKSDGLEAEAGRVYLSAGTGSGQIRRIKGNTATVNTIADDEPDFSPVPDGTTKFMVLYRRCPKDVFESCEQRGRTHAFNGSPTLTPALAQIYPVPPGGVGGGGVGGGGGDTRDGGGTGIML